MNPYDKSKADQIKFLRNENLDLRLKREDAEFARIMWKGLFVVSLAVNFGLYLNL